MASVHYNMVVTRHKGRITMTVRGPETRATAAFCPADADFLGIEFRPGAYLRLLPAQTVMDRHDVVLPEASSRSFWLHGSAWEYPDYDNVETFVQRLVRDGLLVYEPVVAAALRGQVESLSQRSVQRRFVRATGLTYGAIYQIARARYAVALLKRGTSILDTVETAGYADQPHLTRLLKRLVGLTPAQLRASSQRTPLSLLFKTDPDPFGYAVRIGELQTERD